MTPTSDPVGRPLLLLALTLCTTTLVGGCHYLGFEQALDPAFSWPPPDAGTSAIAPFLSPAFLLPGLWYSLTILAILGCHEMGHVLACRYHGVDSTWPYFLPVPLPLTGTLGAFIRIRSPFPSRLALFDIGVAGPLAGVLVAIPALLTGLLLSDLVRLPDDQSGLVELGEPLLFQLAAHLVFGPVPEGFTINMHPMAFAAWFGLLATALNLFPIAQLDGGHISYAVLGPRSLWVTRAMIAVALGLTVLSSSWVAWTVMLLGMLGISGLRHPPTLDDDYPLDTTRLGLAVVAILVLVLCFTPVPLGPFVTGTP